METVSKLPSMIANMVFTQSRGFVLGASFGLQIRSLRCRVLVCHAADTASLAWPSQLKRCLSHVRL